MATEQELFEAAFVKCPSATESGKRFPREETGEYKYAQNRLAWEIWKLARGVPVAYEPTDYQQPKPANYVAPTDKYYTEPKGAV